MWARIAEILLGGWLAASPWLFYRGADIRFWANDIACGAIIIGCAILSLVMPWRRIHLAELLVALWMLMFGFLAAPEPLLGLQNNILVALVLMMFAIVPTEATLPPRSWRQDPAEL